MFSRIYTWGQHFWVKGFAHLYQVTENYFSKELRQFLPHAPCINNPLQYPHLHFIAWFTFCSTCFPFAWAIRSEQNTTECLSLFLIFDLRSGSTYSVPYLIILPGSPQEAEVTCGSLTITFPMNCIPSFAYHPSRRQKTENHFAFPFPFAPQLTDPQILMAPLPQHLRQSIPFLPHASDILMLLF